VFRSGTLQVTPSVSPPRRIHSQPQPRLIASHIVADEGTHGLVGITGDVFTIPEENIDSWDSQSQFDQQSSMSQDISYPPLQTQAPYQSPSLSQSQ